MSAAKRTLEDDQFNVRDAAADRPRGRSRGRDRRRDRRPAQGFPAGRGGRARARTCAAAATCCCCSIPRAPPSVAALAAGLGVAHRRKVVVDPEHRLAGGEGVTLMVSDTLRVVPRERHARGAAGLLVRAAAAVSRTRSRAPRSASSRPAPASYTVAAVRPVPAPMPVGPTGALRRRRRRSCRSSESHRPA